MSSHDNGFRSRDFTADDINADIYKEARRVAAQAGEYTNEDGTTNADSITDYIADEYFSIESFTRRKDLERQGSNQKGMERERVYQYRGSLNCQVILLFNRVKSEYTVLHIENGSVRTTEQFGFSSKKQALAEMLRFMKRVESSQ